MNAFDIAAGGSTPPQRTIFPHPDKADGVTGIATAADGTLDVLQDFRGSVPPDCRVVQEPADATGTGPESNALECNPSAGATSIRGRAIARGVNFEIVVLDSLAGAQAGDYLQRANFSAAAPYATGFIGPLIGAAGTHHGVAEASGGRIFVSSSSAGAPIVYGGSESTTGCSAAATGAATVDNYAPNAASTAEPWKSFTINGRTAAGAIALDPSDNTTLYVATCDAAGALWVDTVSTPGASGPVSPTRSLGPFANNNVTALAVDAQGELFVGLTANDGSATNNVRVYAKNAAGGKPPPLRILQNPLPAGSQQKISGLAISQPPYTAPPAQPTVVYDSIPSGRLSSAFTSLGFQANHELEFGDGVHLTQTGYLHSVSWILRSYGCENRPSGPCVTTAGATFPLAVTTNVYAVSGGGTHVGALLTTQTQTFNIPYRPSSDPTRCPSATDRFFDAVAGRCMDGLGVRLDFLMPGVFMPATAIFTVTFNTQTFGYNPIGMVNCSATAGCPYDQLNVSASTLGGPIGSPYDPNSVFNAVATGTATYEGGDCSPTPLYPANTLTLDNGCWGSTTDFPGGLHPQLQVTIR